MPPHDNHFSVLRSRDPKKVEAWIRAVFVDKKYYSEEGREAMMAVRGGTEPCVQILKCQRLRGNV